MTSHGLSRSPDRELMDHLDLILPDVQSPKQLSLAGDIDDVVGVFRQLPRRRLVVIGPPGAGKTAFLVLLTLGLLEGRRPDEPIPVLLSPSSWEPRSEHFHRWVQSSLEENYPWLRAAGVQGASVAADLVSHGWVMPLLDGLDEMSSAVRPAAIEAINRVGVDLPLVIACRMQEYKQAIVEGDVLKAAAVVRLDSLLPEDVESYLRQSTPPGVRLERWEPVYVIKLGKVAQPLETLQ